MNKVAIYTIAKNEEQHVERFMSTAKEADYIIVLDTGSTDNTVEELRKRGATVHQKEIKPWRFDTARNEALKLVPSDANICVSIDIDEVFEEGWAKNLRRIWDDEMGMLYYYYIAAHNEDGSPGMVFYRDKIHLNDYETYHWKHRIHEILTRPDDIPMCYTSDLICHHYQDTSKDRTSYLPLLEEEIQDYPNDIRIQHLLGREYYADGRYQEAIGVLTEMIKNCGQNHANERYNAYEYIGKSWMELEDDDEAILAFKRSIDIAPYLRANMLNLAMLYLKHLRFGNALEYVNKALEIKDQYLFWADDPDAWREKPYYIAFKVFQMLNMPEQAKIMLEQIEQVNPNFEQLESLKTDFQNLTNS